MNEQLPQLGVWYHDGNHAFHRYEDCGLEAHPPYRIDVYHLAGPSTKLLYRWEVRHCGNLIKMGHTKTGPRHVGKQVYQAAMDAALAWLRD